MLGWLLGLLWMLCVRACLLAHPALDADALSVADLWRSLQQGGHLGDWVMSQHPYVFPDLAVYGAAGVFAQDPAGRQLAYGMVQGFLLWWFLADLMKQWGGLTGSMARAYAAGGLLVLAPFLGGGLGGALAPAYHGGALLCALAWWSWCVERERKPAGWLGLAWTGSLLGLVWASDQIVPLWVIAPGLILSLGLGGRARRGIWGSAALAWIVRGLVLAWWKRQGMQVAGFEWSYFTGHAWTLVSSGLAQTPAVLLGIAAPLALAGLGVGLLAWEGRAHGWSAWLALGILSTGLGALGLGLLQGSLQDRYFIAFVWLGLAWLPLALSRRMEGRPLPLVAAALVGLLWAGAFQGLDAPGLAPAQAQAAWLDSQLGPRGLAQGLADYGHARPLRLLSSRGTVLVPASCEGGALKPFAWVSDRRQFRPDMKVQFVVVNGLDPSALRAHLGPPKETLQGQGLELWIYAVSGPAVPVPAGGGHERT